MAKTTKSRTKKTYSREQVEHWYYEMLLQRRFEERADQMYGQRKIQGFLHLYIGQEAISSGMEAAIRPDDYVITAYRDHGQALTRGISARAVMAELFGKETGCVKGKGGSMHMFSKEKHFYGGHGIVGGQIPLGAGLAFAAKYREEDRVCMTLMGDGAVRQGAFHEALNLAMLWKLPVVFIIENNNYAMGTSVDRTSNVTELYKLGWAYEMPSIQVNGMDVMAVYEGLQEPIERARKGEGPTLVEMKTYRYRGHSKSDPAKYRTKDELQEYKDVDPIVKLKHYILEQKLMTQEELDALDTKVKDEVKDAVEFADKSPQPDPKALYEDVYVQEDYPYITE